MGDAVTKMLADMVASGRAQAKLCTTKAALLAQAKTYRDQADLYQKYIDHGYRRLAAVFEKEAESRD